MDTIKIVLSDGDDKYTIDVKYSENTLIVEHLEFENAKIIKFKSSDVKYCVSYLCLQMFDYFMDIYCIDNPLSFSIDITAQGCHFIIKDEIMENLAMSTRITHNKMRVQINKLHPEDVFHSTLMIGKHYTKMNEQLDKLRITYVKYVKKYIQNILKDARSMLKDIVTLLCVSYEIELKSS